MSPGSADIEQRLAEAAQAERERELTEALRTAMKARQDELTAELSGLQDHYAAELGDVKRLESVSLTHMLASIRGSRDEKVARERAEAQAALYRVTQVQAQLDALRAEAEAARERLSGLADAPGRLAAALDAKERYLRQSGDPRSGDLLGLAEEGGRLTGELRETKEALQAAAAAENALEQVTGRLGSAVNWSTYDTWFGGGAIASSFKHSKLDEAADAAAEADQRLAVLRTELADVGDPGLTAPQLAIGGGTRFADVWFDNIFTDLAVGDRIHQAQQNVAGSVRAVRALQSRLLARQEQAEQRLREIAAERHRLLTS